MGRVRMIQYPENVPCFPEQLPLLLLNPFKQLAVVMGEVHTRSIA